MPKKLRAGVGAICSVSMDYLHPRRQVEEKLPNADKGRRLEALTAIRKEIRRVTTRDQEVMVFRHDDFNCELYSCLRWVKVLQEGPADQLFVERSKAQTSRRGGKRGS